jgi:hypothetical protein
MCKGWRDTIGVAKDGEVVVPEVDYDLEQLSAAVNGADERRIYGFAERQVSPFVAVGVGRMTTWSARRSGNDLRKVTNSAPSSRALQALSSMDCGLSCWSR